MLRAVSSNQVASWNPAQNAHGILPGGAASPLSNGVTVVAASNTPSSSITSTTPGLDTILDNINLPGGVVGPDGWYELWIDWTCNSSANAKQVQVFVDHTATGILDTQTTTVESTFLVRISNRNNTAVNIANSAPRPGQSTTGVINLSLDLSQEGHCIALWANIANAADNMRIERWMLTAHNPPTYSAPRLKYGTQIFWGANAHFDDGQSIAMHIAGMKTMGMKLMRMADEGGTSVATIANYAQAFQADNTGLQLLVCLDMGITTDGTTLFATEAAAYASAFARAVATATALAPYGVTMFECGNEMDTKNGINIGDAQGGLPSDFDNTKVSIFRGIQRGAIDGVHSVNPAFIACSNAYTVCSVALADMMWYGTNPDGSTGHNLVRWDVTSWHNYEDYGPLMGVEMGNSRPWVNIFAYANRRWGGKPIMITEWNAKSSDTDAQRAAWGSRFMYEAYSNRYRYNIAAVLVYELYGSPWAVLDGSLNTPISTFGTTVQSFITSNPDTGL